MSPKVAGHARQLLGYALVFLGLGVAIFALLLAGSHPAIPLWAFVTGAVGLGAPLMIAGGRINSRGRGMVLGQSPERAAEEYRRQNVLMAVYFGFVGLVTLVVVWPVFLWSTGLMHPTDRFVRVWLSGSLLFLCVTRTWVTRPMWRAIERRFTARWAWVPDDRT